MLFEIIDGFKKGFDAWKQVWLRQIVVQMVLGFIAFGVITPLGFLIAIFAANQSFSVTIEKGTLITPALLQLMSKNLGFWISAFTTMFVLVIIVTVITGVIQNVAHQRAKSDDVRLEDNFKEIVPLILPLTVVAIVTIIIIGIPLLVAAEIFHLLSDPNAPVVFSFPLFDTTVDLALLDIISTVVNLLIITLLIGPYFLAITAVVVDNAGISSIVESWKLYSQKFASVVIAVIFLHIIGLLSMMVVYLPINGIVTATHAIPEDLAGIFLNIFLLLILGAFMQLFVINWQYTSLYCYYKEIKE